MRTAPQLQTASIMVSSLRPSGHPPPAIGLRATTAQGRAMTVTETRFRYEGADGKGLAGFVWDDAAPAKAVLQLAHGAGEHAGRYRERLASLVEAGYRIYAADHRGHGLTSGMTHLGDFGPGGAAAAVDDMAVLARRARAENPSLPLILMGHSMGAMFSQVWLTEHSALIDGLL